MAVATPVSYTAASGQRCYGGRFPLSSGTLSGGAVLDGAAAGGGADAGLARLPVSVYSFPGWGSLASWTAAGGFGDIPTEKLPVGGAYDQTLQSVTDAHLILMRDSGIDHVCFDWYWIASSGTVHAGHCINNYFASTVPNKPKAYILYCNADMTPATTLPQWQAVYDYWCANYFSSPDYYKLDGKPLVVMLDRAALKTNIGGGSDATVAAQLNAARTAAAAFGGINFYAHCPDISATGVGSAPAMGFDGITAYNFVGGTNWAEHLAHYTNWYAVVATAPLPVILPISTGWDSRPWGGVLISNPTIAEFTAHLNQAKAIAAAAGPGKVKGFVAEAWDEHGEGAVLVPCEYYGGTARLDAIEAVFGLAPGFVGWPSLPTTGLVTASLTAAAGTKPFCIGHTFKQGDLPAGSTLTGLQCTVKSTWPDGSAKIALLAGGYTSSGSARTVGLQIGAAPTGAALGTAALKATGIAAAVGAGSFGTASWSGSDWDAPFQAWVSGPLMSSWVYRKPIGSDAHLVAWLEVRLFVDGSVEVLPWIENGYIRVAGPTSKSATYAFTLGGTQRFSAAIDLPARARTPLLNGTALSHWLGADPSVVVKHDVAYLQATRLVPRYRASTPANAAVVAALPATFAPLQLGNFTASMGSTGYHLDIGLLPEWDVLYLTSAAPSVWAAMQRNAYSAGRWAIHFRDETTNRPLRFSQNAHLSNNYSPTGDYPVGASGTAAGGWDVPHHPSMGFMAYLVSGRFFHLETCYFVATHNFVCQVDAPVAPVSGNPGRGGADGIFLSASGASTTRGAAWANRSLAQAASIAPDSDTALRAEFIASLEANINFNHARYVGQANNPFGFVAPYGDAYGTGSDGKVTEASWQQDFYTAAFGYAAAMNPPISETVKTKLTQFFAWKAKSVIGRLGGTSAAEWLYRDAAPYNMTVALTDFPDWVGGTGPWAASWGTLYDSTFAVSPSGTRNGAGDLRGGNYPDASSYWANVQPAIAYAVEHNVGGAADAYLRMAQAGNWPTFVANLNATPVWSVAPPLEPGLPAWVPAPGQTANINKNSLSTVSACPSDTCWYSQSSKQQAAWRNWTGATLATEFSQWGAQVFWGGGHGGGEDVSQYVFDLTSGLWSRVGPDNPTTSTYTTQLDSTFYDYLHNGSYIVPALHTYGYPVYIKPGLSGAGGKGSWLLPQLIGGPNSGAVPHAVDLQTGVWSRASVNKGASISIPYSGSLHDTKRNRVWWSGCSDNKVSWLDLNTAHPRTLQSETSVYWPDYYALLVYVEAADMAVSVYCQYGETLLRMAVYDLSSGKPDNTGGFVLPPTMNVVRGPGFGFAWLPATEAFYLYEGYGTTRVLKLKPSSLNFKTCTWAWTEETFSNPAWENTTAANNSSGAQPFTRWAAVPSLKCFLWSDGPNTSGANTLDGVVRDGLVQLWRPAGT